VQLEAVEPADRGLAACGTPGKDPVLMDAWVAAEGKRGGVDEADAATVVPYPELTLNRLCDSLILPYELDK
jgi:hypothetical protein